MRIRSPKRDAFVLPTLILVSLVLLILATALLASGTSGLRVATHDQQSDQALYAAEAGLARAAAVFAADGAIASPMNGNLGSSGSGYSVMAYENTSAVEMLAYPGGPTIPPSTVYLRSEGISENGTRRQSGALFTIGLQAFKVGALGDQVQVTDSTFDAYQSADGDYNPGQIENNLPLLASNSAEGDTFLFAGSDIHGDVFVGPGGNPESQIAATDSTMGNTQAMEAAIELEDIEVPPFPDEEETEGETDWGSLSLGPVEVVEVNGNGIISFDDGDGLSFDLHPDLIDENNPSACFPGQPFQQGEDLINGQWVKYIQLAITDQDGKHYLLLREDGTGYYQGAGQSMVESVSGSLLASVVFGNADLPTSGPPTGGLQSVTNPSVLEPGFYDTVTVNDNFAAMLSEEGTYVIKNLLIEEGSHLTLPEGAANARFYITETLNIKGDNAIGNASRKPPKVKVFYTGAGDVELSGGSQSYFTLVAPGANINLTSPFGDAPTQFFGALVGKQVVVNNANFHFDTSTSGIGTGTMGSAVSLIQRHRL